MRRALMRCATPILAAAFAAVTATTTFAQDPLADVLDAFEFRNLGPFRAGAWITDFAVPATPEGAHRYTFYVGTRNGGVWKTENAGTSFAPIFDAQDQQSIGAVAVAPSDPDIVWVGTGESYVARYSYSGDGIYRSTDGGATWRHMGLRASQHIARIVIHPRDPGTVFVASMGPLHTRNEARGVFRTRDGGETWERVLFIDDQVGVIDMVMDPTNPDVLYAATYDKERTAWRLDQGGPGSGIWKTVDGGTTWSRLEGGLPAGEIGRIGIDVFRGDPDILYAVVENLNPRPEGLPQPNPVGGGMGEVYRSDDGGATWRMTHDPRINVGGKAPYSFNWLRIDPEDADRVWVTSVWLAHTRDGGRTWADLDTGGRELFRRMFGDIRALWVDPEDPDRLLVGSDGGVYATYDGGRTVRHLSNMPLGEIYALAVDMDDPYHVHAGLQDHESWRAPINGFAGAIGVENWVTVGTGDGMYNAVDPTDSRWVYNTQQFGGHYRQDLIAGERTNIAPRAPDGASRYRYTWTTPLVLSPHDPSTLITAAHVVLRSRDRGDTWQEISPDLTTGALPDAASRERCTLDGAADGNVWYCTITTVAESPHTRGVLWAATDDGRIHVTRDDGASWTDATAAITAAGAPDGYWYTRVTPSQHAAGTAYATITGFHRDDFRPFVFRTDDFGATWRSLSASLPENAPANVLVEDHRNADLLFLGTDRGLFASMDGGARWTMFRASMPIVPVRDLVIHPRENDLVVGTHGRAIYVADITPLQQLTREVLAGPLHLFAPEPKGLRVESAWGNYALDGDHALVTPNEPNGMLIWYWLREAPSAPVAIRITDAAGALVATLQQPPAAGLQHVVWNLRHAPQGGGRGGRGGGGGSAPVPPGEYTITILAGEQEQTRHAIVEPSVALPRISAPNPPRR
jgi:photosystem II stability/assembly factor-like uncharacterized protein